MTTRLLSGYSTAKKSKVDMRVRSANAQLRREHHNAQTRGLTNAQTVCTKTERHRSCADFNELLQSYQKLLADRFFFIEKVKRETF
jgi:hypothetical protein